MSVPLDRLYNYLQDVVNHDILIYRWNPHGSKNLKDLSQLNEYTLIDELTRAPMICHDQEPLDYHQYDNIFDCARPDLTKFEIPPDVLEYVAEITARNLRLINVANIYGKTLLLHSELNSSQIEIYKEHNFLPVYYWSHGVIAKDWFRYAEHDPSLDHRLSKVPFLIYNRAWSGTREYRLKFAEMLVKIGLSPLCRMGFSLYDNHQSYKQHEFKNSNMRITSTDLENYFFENTTPSSHSADYTTHDYQETMIEVVLETLFDDTRWHLTEKTLRPIACGQPFILAATPGSLQYLRSYGFETFDGLIDETYDTIKDPVQRLQAIIQEMRRLTTVLPSIHAQLLDIAARNKKRFFSAEFHNRLIDEYKENLQSAMETMQLHKDTKHWEKYYQATLKLHSSNKLEVLDYYMAHYYPFCDAISGENTILTTGKSSTTLVFPYLKDIDDYIKTLK